VTDDKLADGAVNSAKVLDGSLTADDLHAVRALRAGTVEIPLDDGGGSQTMLAVGGVELRAFCAEFFTGWIASIEAHASGGGRMLVTDGDGGSADEVAELGPPTFKADVVFIEDSQLAAKERSFAVLDDSGDSLSGVAAVLLEPGERCQMTAHVMG
jgi:hypothetical protein